MERDLYEAGFSKVMIVDSQVDLNVYAKLALEGGEGSQISASHFSLTQSTMLTHTDCFIGSSCCGSSSSCSSTPTSSSAEFGITMLEMAKKINANEYAMSVKVYAVK